MTDFMDISPLDALISMHERRVEQEKLERRMVEERKRREREVRDAALVGRLYLLLKEHLMTKLLLPLDLCQIQLVKVELGDRATFNVYIEDEFLCSVEGGVRATELNYILVHDQVGSQVSNPDGMLIALRRVAEQKRQDEVA